MRKKKRKIIAVATAAAMMASTFTLWNSSLVMAAEEYDPFGAYDETITMTLGRRTTLDSEQRLSEHEGWTYEDNAVINWYEEQLNVEFIDQFEAKDGEDYDRQLALAVAAEDIPDVMQVYSRDMLNELVENDMVADLTDAYNNYASDMLKETYDSYGEHGLSPAMYDGKLMALPGVLYGTQNASLVWIRQDWLDDLGIKIDENDNGIITREELELVAREFVEKDPGGTGNPVGIANYTYVEGDPNRAIFNSFHSYPGKWLKAEDGTIYNGSVAPETKDALAYMHELYEEGLFDPQYGTRTYDDIVALLGNGQLGIFLNMWAAGSGVFINAFELGDKDIDLSCFILGDENEEAAAPLVDTLNGFLVVRKDYEHPEAVVKLANLIKDSGYGAKNSDPDFESTEYYQMIVAGKETTCLRPFTIYWEGNDDLEMKMFQPVLDYLDGKITEDEFPIPTTNREILAAYNDYKAVEDDRENMDGSVWQNYHKWFTAVGCLNKIKSAGAWKWTDCIYTAPTESMLEVGADLSKLTEETYVKIIVGDLSIDDFDSYVEEWYDIGGADCCEELAEIVGE